MVAGVHTVLRLNALQGFAPITIETALSPSRYTLGVMTLLSAYLQKLLLPLNLAFFHQFRVPARLLSPSGLTDLAEAYNNLGVLLAKSGQMEPALPHFETAARLKPDDPSFETNLRRALNAMQDVGRNGAAKEPTSPGVPYPK